MHNCINIYNNIHRKMYRKENDDQGSVCVCDGRKQNVNTQRCAWSMCESVALTGILCCKPLSQLKTHLFQKRNQCKPLTDKQYKHRWSREPPKVLLVCPQYDAELVLQFVPSQLPPSHLINCTSRMSLVIIKMGLINTEFILKCTRGIDVCFIMFFCHLRKIDRGICS